VRFAVSIPQAAAGGSFDPVGMHACLAQAEEPGFASAWTGEQVLGTLPMPMIVSATSREAAEGEGWKVARALGAGPRAEVSAEPWTRTRL
jgi:hypothetical protein